MKPKQIKVKFYFYNGELEHYWIKTFYDIKGIQDYIDTKELPFDIENAEIKYKIL